MRTMMAFILLFLFGCQYHTTMAGQPSLERDMKDLDTKNLVTGNTSFGIDLYTELKNEQPNLFFSPFNISTVMSMVASGARGETASQMTGTLHLAPENGFSRYFGKLLREMNAAGSDTGVELSTANSVWIDSGYRVLKDYIENVETHYAAEVRTADFRSAFEAERKKINQWVKAETQKKIEELLPRGVLDEMTRLVLVSAIYFKGDWLNPFEERRTRPLPFYIAPGKSVSAPTMHQQNTFNYFETESLQLLELPYAGEKVSMLVFLPREKGGLSGMEQNLSSVSALDSFVSRMKPTKIRVFLPRFKAEAEFSLGEKLQKLGMTSAFNMDADLSGIDGTRKLFITAVVHKAVVEVNEKGTEAAAASGAVVGVKSMMPRMPIFRADHPFLYLIRDNQTGSILFMGRLANPV